MAPNKRLLVRVRYGDAQSNLKQQKKRKTNHNYTFNDKDNQILQHARHCQLNFDKFIHIII